MYCRICGKFMDNDVEIYCDDCKKMLENESVNVYRIGYGLPVGADIEYADDITLMRALESKKEM